jgi:hypothetical protein
MPRFFFFFFFFFRKKTIITVKNVKTVPVLNSLRPNHKDVWKSGGTVPLLLASTLGGGEWSTSHPNRFIPEECAPGTHSVGGWVDSRGSLDAV